MFYGELLESACLSLCPCVCVSLCVQNTNFYQSVGRGITLRHI